MASSMAVYCFFVAATLSIRAVKPLASAMGIQGASFLGAWSQGY